MRSETRATLTVDPSGRVKVETCSPPLLARKNASRVSALVDERVQESVQALLVSVPSGLVPVYASSNLVDFRLISSDPDSTKSGVKGIDPWEAPSPLREMVIVPVI
jgi:hypothetical protein